MKQTNIVFSGEGGQGIQTMAKIFSDAAFSANLEVASLPYFGVEQRGTPSMVYVSLSGSPLRNPKFEIADYVIILQSRAVSSVEKYISPNTKVIFDSSTTEASSISKTSAHIFGIPATKLANEKFSPKSFNIIVLGYLSKIFDFKEDLFWASIEKSLGQKFKKANLEEISKEAYIYGRELVVERDKFSKSSYKPKTKTILVQGHGKKGEIVPNRCKGCGICLLKCPVGALSFGDELGVFATPVPKIDLEKCIACGNCRAFCPDGAISIEKVKK